MKTVVRNFFPVFIGRGVVQISAYVDGFWPACLPTGAVSALAYAQTLYTLPGQPLRNVGFGRRTAADVRRARR